MSILLAGSGCGQGDGGSAAREPEVAEKAPGEALDSTHPWELCIYQSKWDINDPPVEKKCGALGDAQSMWHDAYVERFNQCLSDNRVTTNVGFYYVFDQFFWCLKTAPFFKGGPPHDPAHIDDAVVADVRTSPATPEVMGELVAEEDYAVEAIVAERGTSIEVNWQEGDQCGIFGWLTGCDDGKRGRNIQMPANVWHAAVTSTQWGAYNRDGRIVNAYLDRSTSADVSTASYESAAMDALAVRAQDPVIEALLAQLRDVIQIRDALTHGGARLDAADGATRAALAQFLAVKDGEGAAKSALGTIAADGNAADGPGTVSAMLAALSWLAAESGTADQLETTAARALAEVSAAGAAFDAAMTTEGGAMAARGIPRPRVSSQAQTALGDVVAYAHARKRNAESAARTLVMQLGDRASVLQALTADAAARDTFAKTQLLDASKRFLDGANARAADVTTLPPSTPRLKAPLLAARYDALASFLQLKPLCDASTVSAAAWREAGCQVYGRNFSRAQSTLAILPAMLKGNASLLQKQGADAAVVARLQSALAAGDVRTAATLSDAALIAIDPPPASAAATTPAPITARAVAPATHVGGAASARTSAPRAVRVEDKSDPVNRQGDCVIGDPNVCTDRDQMRDAVWQYMQKAAASESLRDTTLAELFVVQKFARVPFAQLTVDGLMAALGPDAAKLDPTFVDNLKELVQAIASTAPYVRDRINEAGAAARAAGAAIEGKPMVGAQQLGRDFSAPSLYQAPTFDVPVVQVPGIGATGAYDDPSVPYGAMADRVVSDLGACVAPSGVRDHARFLAVLRAWNANVAALEPDVHARAGSAPGEAAAFAAAKQRVSAFTATYVDGTGWFLDGTTPAPVRAAIDGVLADAAPREAQLAKDALNAPASPFDTTRQPVLDALVALAGALAAAPASTLDADGASAIHDALTGAAFAANGGAASGTFGAFCSVVTALDGCRTTGAPLPLGARVDRALSIPITASAFWTAASGTASVDAGPRVARVLQLMSGLSAADRRALVGSVGGAALDHLADAPLADVQKLVAALGAARVRVLGATLDVASLQQLGALSFFHLADDGQQKAAQAAGTSLALLGSLAGSSLASLRARLTAASYAKAPTADGAGETWTRPDGATVLVYPSGNEERPGTPFAVRAVTSGGALVASLVDASAAVAPYSASDAHAQLATWFASPSNAGRAPTSDESAQLDGLWLESTRALLTTP